jgi:hypothetical protein
MTDERITPQPDEAIEDLDVPAEESEDVKGGVRKAGEKPVEYLTVEPTNVLNIGH